MKKKKRIKIKEKIPKNVGKILEKGRKMKTDVEKRKLMKKKNGIKCRKKTQK